MFGRATITLVLANISICVNFSADIDDTLDTRLMAACCVAVPWRDRLTVLAWIYTQIISLVDRRRSPA